MKARTGKKYTKYEINTILNSISGTYKELYFNIFKNKLQTLHTKQIDKILTHCNPVFENKVYKTDNKKNKIQEYYCQY
jgi:hypothetical protein